MTRTPTLGFHRFALMFPSSEGNDWRSLKDDIRRHGIKVPVVLFEGKILDGRSRYQIGRELGIPIPTVEFNGTIRNALDLAASYNLYRRHLNPSQKAIVAAEMSQVLCELDGVQLPEAREIAAKATGAKVGYVEKAERIIENRPKVAEKIRNGDTTIGEFYGRSLTTCPSCGHRW